jgi:alpha-tubulin suppressor-like RCC1 family protein
MEWTCKDGKKESKYIQCDQEISGTACANGACLPDADGDQKADIIDNCPKVPNPDQKDSACHFHVVSVTAAVDNTCAMMSNGTVYCWGRNENATLGFGFKTSPMSAVLVPTSVPSLTGIQSLHLASFHSCAIMSDSSVSCWGSNQFGQLGLGANVNESFIPKAVPGLSGASDLDNSVYANCAVIKGGKVMCWGGWSGKTPIEVPQLANVTHVELIYQNACAILSDQSVKCWGENTSVPVVMPNLKGVTSLEAGFAHFCALKLDGKMACWGRNIEGQLGLGTTSISVSTPTVVPGISGIIDIGVNERSSCALVTGGKVLCWGRNALGIADEAGSDPGLLGVGSSDKNVLTPKFVLGLNGVVALTKGATHSCVLMPDKSVQCWGANYIGQLGLGNASLMVTTPTPVKFQ